MAINDIAKVTIVGEIHGQETNNVLHFRLTNNLGTMNDLINAIIDCIRTALLPGLAADWKLREVRARTIYPTATDDVVTAGAGTDVGGVASDGLPSFNAALVSIKTGLAGRTKRGRFYLAGVPESGQLNSRLTSGELTAIVAYCTCMVNKFISATSTEPFYLGVLSRKLIAAGQTPAAAFTEATSLIATNVLGTQNRRKLGHGS